MTNHKIAWLTDIHLNFLTADKRIAFYRSIDETQLNSILITGDIAEANTICELLTECSTHTQKPIYFVLGNHDYYRGSILDIRKNVAAICKNNPTLCWLGKPTSISLSNDTILLGHDGWADGRYGDFDHSPINLNDSRFIAELYQPRKLS